MQQRGSSDSRIKGRHSGTARPESRKAIESADLQKKLDNLIRERDAALARESAIADKLAQRDSEYIQRIAQQTAVVDVLKLMVASPGDPQPVFDMIAVRARDLCDAYGVTVIEFDGALMHHRASTGVSDDPARRQAVISSYPAPPDARPAGRAILERQTIRIDDLDAAYDRNKTSLPDVKSLVMVPMLRSKLPIGVLVMGGRGFSDIQVELLETFAEQAVIAIQNVKLFDEVQARTRELSQSLDDLRAAQDRLVQTEKLASLGQLTAGIAHEIKNPLNFVNNFSALSAELTDELNDVLKPIAMDGKVRGEVDELTGLLKDNLGKVVQHGKRADSIVKNMLQHSREGSGERRSADINALVGESLNLAYHAARAEKPGFTINLKQALDRDAGALELYPQEITRALLNLISNGFYAAVGRKAVTDDSAFEPILSAATRNLGETVEIRIRDNGSGIPPDVREKIFNPFFTTKPTGEGTGLGLSMAHDIIVKQHGGRIDVETEPGTFTEFIVTLPRRNGNAGSQKSE